MSDNNLFDDFMEYKLSSSSSSDDDGDSPGDFPTLHTPRSTSYSSNASSQKSGQPSNTNCGSSGVRISTLVMLFYVLAVISGTLPINTFTVIVALILAGVLFIRFLGS